MKKLRGAAIPPSSLNNSESEEERTEEVSARALRTHIFVGGPTGTVWPVLTFLK